MGLKCAIATAATEVRYYMKSNLDHNILVGCTGISLHALLQFRMLARHFIATRIRLQQRDV
jgi:hypothetical protein